MITKVSLTATSLPTSNHIDDTRHHAAEIAVDRKASLLDEEGQTEPQAQAMKALGRQSAEICELGRTEYWSTRMTAPMGGTRMPSSDSHSMKNAQTLQAATTMPMMPSTTAMHAHVVADDARPAGCRVVEAVRTD